VSNIEERVVRAVRPHPAVRRIRLVGSQAEGRATPSSDWDFRVDAADFEALARGLFGLLAPLDPIAQQWDRLSDHQCWMVMLRGPVKIDLIFPDEAHELEPAWVPAPDNLEAIDRHFWDWVLWLDSKDAARKKDVVRAELRKLFDHVLAPLGATREPSTVAEAVDMYRDALGKAEDRLEVRVPRVLEAEVRPALGVLLRRDH
jgi:hypothetical protein